MSDEKLIQALKARKPVAAQRTWRCPDDATLAGFADAGLKDHEKESVESHMVDCGFCLAQLGALLRLSDAGPPQPVSEWLLSRARALTDPSVQTIARPAWQWAAVAATAVLAISAALWIYQPGTESVRTVRSGSGNAVSPELLFPREGMLIAPEDVEFRWQEREDALFYEVSLVTSDGDLVWEVRLENSETKLPPEVKLVTGRRYFVWIRTYLPDGRALKSETVGFELQDGE